MRTGEPQLTYSPLCIFKYKMGRQGFEPWKAEPTDLQSAPFDRSGISPYLLSQLRDSNPRPRDYKSRALAS